MKIFTFIFLLFVLISCSGKKSKEQGSNPTEALAQTTIEFETVQYDLKQLKAGEIAMASFTFTNTGEYDYRIEGVETDCGCLTVHFPEHPVKPGEQGVIEVEFDSSGMIGREYKSIEINGNSGDLKHLAIFAEVKNELLEIKY